jgi:hypothetical protein
MSLISPEFEKKARALHRAEMERSPELREEFKRLRKSESSSLNRITRRILMPIFWNCIFLNVALKTRDVSLTAAVITLWAGATAFRWGWRWFQQFYASEDLVVLNLLPLDDRRIFRFQTFRYLSAVGWTAWELLLAYGVLGIVEGSGGMAFYFLPLAALLQSVLVLALALHVASRLQMLPLNGIAGLLYATAFALLVLGTQEVQSTHYIIQAANWFLPTGWVNYILLRVRQDPVTLALLLPIAAIIYLARHSWDRLRGLYSLEGFEILSSSPRGAPTTDDEELTAGSFGHRPGPTEIEERIAARSFLLGVNWQAAGWLERFVSRFLSARERVITEFLVAQDPGWSRGFRWSFWVWLVACVIVILLGHLGGTLVFFMAYILVTASLPLFGGDWRGMRQSHAGGVSLPGFALYPISFNSIVRIFLRVNFIRILTALPFILSFAALAAWKLNESPVSGLAVGAKLLGILVASQPLLVLVPISAATNDKSRMRFLWLGLFFPALIILIASAVGVFWSASIAGVFLGLALLFMVSTLLFVVYRRSYRRGRFDLFNQRRQLLG